ncbi:41651_t:CDS:2, partial [Gigaspora margarita]
LHKYKGIVRANALTRRKNLRENEHDEILEQNMAKRQKNKTPQCCFNTLNNSPLLEYPHNNDTLSWDEKVEFELSTLKDTTNIWNNSTITQPLEVTETTQEPPKTDLISTKGNKEQETTEQITHYAPAPTPDLANMGMNMSITETQIQATMELPDKKIDQVTMGLNPDTNSSEMEMIDPTENRLTSPQVTKAEALDPEEAPEGTSIPVYMQGNENKRDEIDTLGSTSNTVTQHQESYSPEMTTKDTLPGDAEWLSINRI